MLSEYEHQKGTPESHHSEYGQDGVIEEIFHRIGTVNKFFIEFGSRLPWRLNSAYLRKEEGWEGLLFDAKPGSLGPKGDHQFKGEYSLVNEEQLTSRNINLIFEKYGVASVFDLLTIDIDGQDYWVWKAIDEKKFKPRVVSIEFDYGIKSGNEESLVPPLDPEYYWARGMPPCPCSLKALEQLAKSKGYSYVHSLRPHNRSSRREAGNFTTIHAFFVLNDALRGHEDLIEDDLREYPDHSLYRYRYNKNRCRLIDPKGKNSLLPPNLRKGRALGQRVKPGWKRRHHR